MDSGSAEDNRELVFSGSEATARALLESAAEGIVTVDRDGRILQVNAKTEEIFGYRRKELIGQTMEILLPQSLRQMHSGQRKEYFHHPRKRPMGVGMDLVGLRKDGSEFPVEVSLSYVREGEKFLAIAFISDISERKRSEEALRQAKETLAVVINASPLAIWAADLEGKLTLWNQAAERMFGWTAEEVLGQPAPMIPADQQDEFRALFDMARNGKGQSNVERVRVKKDGRPISASVWTAPLSDPHGAIRGVLAIVADSTERKQWEAQLRQSQKMEAIGRLAGGIAHDFNNLLTVITGYSDLVLRSLEEGNPLRRDVEEIRKAGDRASRLTHQLLAFGRRQVVQPRVLDLNSLIRDLHKMLRRTIGENCEISPALDPSPAYVEADPGQIEQVLINLVLNARDAMPKGGRITIETANVDLGAEYARTHLGMQPGPYVMMAVSDQGHGMDEQTRARVFEPFFSTKENGTGLGLATVYGIVKQSRGEIWVYSEPGFGSTFKIYFPRAAGTAEQATVPAALNREVGRTETVLLVEDEPGVRRLVGEMLRLRGYQVLEAADSQAALRIGRTHGGPIHLLLTDVVMPHMQGSELAERLLNLHPAMKVLFMSGYTDKMVVQHGVLEADTAFLQKPFTAEVLERKMREVLDSGACSA